MTTATLHGERFITLAEAARLAGKRCTHTIRDWIRNGLQTPTGRIVKLKALPFGSTWRTTERWLLEFCTEKAGLNQPPIMPETAAAEKRRGREAKRRGMEALR